MRDKRWLVVAGATLVALAVGACEKPVREARTEPAEPSQARPAEVAPAPAGDPTTASAVVSPDTAPAAAETQPAPTLLTINGVDVPFPATKLMLRQPDRGNRVTAELFSDLPKSALREYQGNELLLEMKLEEGGADGKVDGVTWTFKSTHSGKADSPNGIFLNGQSVHLQPEVVQVKFERRGDQLFAVIMGQFRAFEAGTPDALAPFVGVRGELAVEIVQKR